VTRPAVADCISRRRIGEIEFTVIRTGRLIGPPWSEWLTPGSAGAPDEPLAADSNTLVARTPDALIVIDPANFPSGSGIEGFELELPCDLGEALKAAEVDPAEVTHVLVTHGHSDHFSGLSEDGRIRFGGARHLFPEADYEQRDDWWSEEMKAQIEPVAAAGLLHPTAGEVHVTADVDYLSAPGESPGHHVVRIDSVWYLGDLFHFAVEVEHLDWRPRHAEPVQLERSRRQILQRAAGHTALFTHGAFPGWGRIERDGGGWRYAYDA
jgi:glyoxylase-like metal-dependent hydrolase (beta-lactamase superfamily II)